MWFVLLGTQNYKVGNKTNIIMLIVVKTAIQLQWNSLSITVVLTRGF